MLLLLTACTFFPDDKAPATPDDSGDSLVSGDDSEESQPPDDSDSPPDPTGWPGQVFAPYVDATAYPTPPIADIYERTRVPYYTLGFVVDETGQECAATWGTYYSIEEGPTSWDGGSEYTLYQHIARLREAGGDVMVSFGGAANTELAAACTDVDALAAEYARVIDTLQLSHVDFDIEGAALADVGPGSATQRRAQALARVQEDMDGAGRPLRIWLTLPVLPSGLTTEGLMVLKDTLREGVKLSGVNIMTMDYGDGAAPDPDGQMGLYGLGALEALHAQLGTAYTELGQPMSDEALWGMVGTTPMIGRNDVSSEVFQLSDATLTLEFVQIHSVARLSMWSVNRDHPCPAELYARGDCSSTPDQLTDYAYMAIFHGLEGG